MKFAPENANWVAEAKAWLRSHRWNKIRRDIEDVESEGEAQMNAEEVLSSIRPEEILLVCYSFVHINDMLLLYSKYVYYKQYNTITFDILHRSMMTMKMLRLLKRIMCKLYSSNQI